MTVGSRSRQGPRISPPSMGSICPVARKGRNMNGHGWGGGWEWGYQFIRDRGCTFQVRRRVSWSSQGRTPWAGEGMGCPSVGLVKEGDPGKPHLEALV